MTRDPNTALVGQAPTGVRKQMNKELKKFSF